LLSYDLLSKKPLLFKSFTGITVQEFDDIYNKKIAKKYPIMIYKVYHQKENIEIGSLVQEDLSS